jgi:Holliday junction resolvase
MTIEREELSGWKVFRNYASEGCDLVVMGPRAQINLEVKTRQSLLVSRQPNQVQFTITKKEKESSHFVLAYWFNRSTFFIVPTEELQETSSRGITLYKFTARYSVKTGQVCF